MAKFHCTRTPISVTGFGQMNGQEEAVIEAVGPNVLRGHGIVAQKVPNDTEAYDWRPVVTPTPQTVVTNPVPGTPLTSGTEGHS